MKIQRAVSLKRYTTFQIGGKADYFCAVETINELISALKFAKNKKLPIFILGGGSNLLVSDKGLNGLVVQIKNHKLKIENSRVIAGAGISLAKLLNITANAGLSGLEWATGIPGTLGGAVRGNAGAFGQDMAQSIKNIQVYDSQKNQMVSITNKACKFGYRGSIFKFKTNWIILSANLIFKKDNSQRIREKMREHLNYRKARHPRDASAGSVFKNFKVSAFQFKTLIKKFPEFEQFQNRGDIPAAFLISQCGFCGKKIGGAQISKKHPNFIINRGNAKADDVLKLINLIKKSVKAKFQIKLTEEIQFFGF